VKRSTLIKLLSPIVIKSVSPSVTAELSINQLEELDLLKPTHKKIRILRDIENMPYEDEVVVSGWENE
jgi:hypothetical protein